MRGSDIPQTDDLKRVVQVVQALAGGAASVADVAAAVGLSERHAAYALNAARILDLASDRDGSWTLRARGRELAQAQPAELRSRLQQAVSESRTLQRLAPALLDGAAPDEERLVRDLGALTRLSETTRRRRARTLLAWRRQLRDGELPLPPVRPAPPEPELEDLLLRRVEVRNYGLLREVRADLGKCTVVVGRNATGKSTFLDGLAFLSDALELGVEAAWRRRTEAWRDLLWSRQGDAFDLAVEIALPPGLSREDRLARYELSVGLVPGDAVGVRHEALFLKPPRPAAELLHESTPKGWTRILAHGAGRAAWFKAEAGEWKTNFQLSSDQLALAWVQPSPERFPVALRVADLLRSGVTTLALSAEAMRRPCSPLLGGRLRRNGENLPLRVARLQADQPARFERWVAQLREALPDIKRVEVAERPEDRHRYLVVQYRGGLAVPAWRLSDGTLRILALTLLGFLDEDAIILVEEPENGVHPRALEAVYEALSAAPRTQLVLATHSPTLLGIVPPRDLLCFSVEDGQTRIQAGSEHELLKGWKGEVDLGTLFASGMFE